MACCSRVIHLMFYIYFIPCSTATVPTPPYFPRFQPHTYSIPAFGTVAVAVAVDGVFVVFAVVAVTQSMLRVFNYRASMYKYIAYCTSATLCQCKHTNSPKFEQLCNFDSPIWLLLYRFINIRSDRCFTFESWRARSCLVFGGGTLIQYPSGVYCIYVYVYVQWECVRRGVCRCTCVLNNQSGFALRITN